MKPRPVNVTREFVGAQRQPPEGWPTDKANLFDDPEDKTPVAPAPSLAMLAVAGAPWYMRHRTWIGGGAGISLILLAFLFGMRASTPPPAQQPPPVAAAPLLPAVAPPPALTAPTVPETIVLSVTVSPASAQVLIDGQLMPSNPFLTRFPRSTATHRLRATAPGYQPKERWVSFADNVMLDISLSPGAGESSRERDRSKRREPVPARRAPVPTAAATPAPVAAPPAHRALDISPRPETEKPRRRRIEASDPYASDQ